MYTNTTHEKYKVLDRDTIKYIAMLPMLLSHIISVFPTTWKMVNGTVISIGYFTGIVMIYFLMTKNGILEFNYCNILFNLCVCFGILHILNSKIHILIKGIAVILGIYIGSFLDWLIYAPIFTVLFFGARNSLLRTKIAFGLNILIYASCSFYKTYGLIPVGLNIKYTLLSISGMVIAAICIIFFYNGKSGKKSTVFSKGFFYVLYPVHLLILGILRLVL